MRMGENDFKVPILQMNTQNLVRLSMKNAKNYFLAFQVNPDGS